IVQPVEIGERLEIGLVLDQLFGAAVKQADVGIDALDRFAVKLHDHAQHAVGGRVLGPEVDRVVGDDLVAGGRRLFKLHGHDQLPSGAGPEPPSLPAFLDRGLRAGRLSVGSGALSALAFFVALGAALALLTGLAAALLAFSPAPVSAGLSVVLGTSTLAAPPVTGAVATGAGAGGGTTAFSSPGST